MSDAASIVPGVGQPTPPEPEAEGVRDELIEAEAERQEAAADAFDARSATAKAHYSGKDSPQY